MNLLLGLLSLLPLGSHEQTTKDVNHGCGSGYISVYVAVMDGDKIKKDGFYCVPDPNAPKEVSK